MNSWFGCSISRFSIIVSCWKCNKFGALSEPLWTGTKQIFGDIHYMCVEPDGSHAYILSYLGDNASRLISYNCSSYLIESQVDLRGYPLDLDISPGGTLLVLTAE